MEINIGNKFGGNMGVLPDTADTGIGSVSRTAADAAQGAQSAPNLTVGNSVADISAAEPATAVPDSALTRDDALGNLVNSAFALPPPPMPPFVD